MAVDRFGAALTALGLDVEVREMDSTTHTAAQAAEAIGCDVGAIVKSLVFVADGEPLLALVSGSNRVDESALGEHLGATIGKADARTVKDATGYSIGGVPPLGHPAPLRTVFDPDLLAYDEVWAAAGSATAVFGIAPQRLLEVTGAVTVRVN